MADQIPFSEAKQKCVSSLQDEYVVPTISALTSRTRETILRTWLRFSAFAAIIGTTCLTWTSFCLPLVCLHTYLKCPSVSHIHPRNYLPSSKMWKRGELEEIFRSLCPQLKNPAWSRPLKFQCLRIGRISCFEKILSCIFSLIWDISDTCLSWIF